MTALDERLARAVEVEPPLGDAVDLVFRQAERLRRRRIRAVLLAGLVTVALLVALGYGAVSLLVPTAGGDSTSRPPSGSAADPVATVLTEVADLIVVPRLPG